MYTKPKAFTFIEVMVALTIVALALSALIHMQIISINLTERSEMMTQAVLLAEEKMAEVMTGSASSFKMTKGTVNRNGREYSWQAKFQDLHSKLPITLNPNSTQTAGSTIRSNPTLASLNFNDIAPLRRVDITVHWLDCRTKKQIQLTSYLPKRNFQ